jgi:hypothetical protein
MESTGSAKEENVGLFLVPLSRIRRKASQNGWVVLRIKPVRCYTRTKFYCTVCHCTAQHPNRHRGGCVVCAVCLEHMLVVWSSLSREPSSEALREENVLIPHGGMFILRSMHAGAGSPQGAFLSVLLSGQAVSSYAPSGRGVKGAKEGVTAPADEIKDCKRLSSQRTSHGNSSSSTIGKEQRTGPELQIKPRHL